MFPSRRRRRASFFPREERTSAAIVISFLKTSLLLPGLKSDSPSRTSKGYVGSTPRDTSHKQIADRSLLVDRLDSRSHQLRDRQRFDPVRFPRLFRERDRIRKNHLLQIGCFD